MTYFEKTLGILELPAVRQLLCEHCISAGAKKIALNLMPSANEAEIHHRLSETTAAVNLCMIKGAPSFYGILDVVQSLHRAELGGCLNQKELLDIASLLQCSRITGQYIKDDKLPDTVINSYFGALHSNRYLEDKIKNAVLSENEIADNASPELAAIRKKMRQEEANVRGALQNIISSPGYSKYLQEPIITSRSGRYVVPVRIEHKNDIQGLVHDVSASGMTVFVEPIAAVKANNALKELEAREKSEIERILAELSAECAKFSEDISNDYFLLTKLDFIFAKAALSLSLNASEAEMIPENGIVLRHARHPLLDKAKVVPTDLSLGNGYDTLVITGPNTGGKTVCLKTIGLLALMNQCGLHIPAACGSNLPVFESILADIGDEQSIEQNLSTFSSHMKNIISIIEESGEKSLVLFDELGAGTDPTEGAALAVSIIEHIRRKGALVAATTHYSELKTYALNSENVQNASCEFDVQTLRPTYRIILGIPGKSNAFAISSKLGLPYEIISDASSRIGKKDADMESTIAKLDAIRNELENSKDEIASKLKKAEENERKSALLRAELEVRLEKADIKARRDAERMIEEARATTEEVFKELDEMKRSFNADREASEINEERNRLRRRLNETESSFVSARIPPDDTEKKPVREIVAGDRVIIRSMNMKADVISVLQDGNLRLRAGIMNVTAGVDDIILDDSPEKKKKKSYSGHTELRTATVPSEIDLRGMESVEAVYVTEQYLDNAVMGKLKTVRIIHGKGTGALRTAIQKMLKGNKLVKSFRIGNFGEGEDGVTIVELK